jgi:hypothetical protein
MGKRIRIGMCYTIPREDESMQHVSDSFQSSAGRPPRDGEIYVDPATSDLWCHRGAAPHGKWEQIGPMREAGTPSSGVLQFELAPDLIIEGSPQFVISVFFRTHVGLSAPKAKDAADLVFRMLRECGWKAPAEVDPTARPGTVSITWTNSSKEHHISDLRPVYGQLQSPDFSGFLCLVLSEGRTEFLSVKDALYISINEDGVQDFDNP